jgi:hypothetical protein
VPYRLLQAFRELFEGKEYRHRRSNLGDQVASYLYDDLYELARSPKFGASVSARTHVVNTANVTVGVSARRGDGTFGERVPGAEPTTVPQHLVALGKVATIDVGIEVKILAKAMIKQLDRVGTDMLNQVSEFRRHKDAICVGIVGINQAASYTSYEGDRAWPTTGKGSHVHPVQEAAQAEQRLLARVRDKFDEIVVLRFLATNVSPFPFAWQDSSATEQSYAASLVRISREYERRF